MKLGCRGQPESDARAGHTHRRAAGAQARARKAPHGEGCKAREHPTARSGRAGAEWRGHGER
eukprot:4821355-Alexandrium_andersonii.AAC.1